MAKLKDKIGGIIMLIVFAVFCNKCTTDYFKGGDNKAISNYEKMIFDKSIAEAELYPEYREVTVKILKVPIKTYEFRYFFNLEGKKYEGQHTFSGSLPESSVLSVYYLKDDPNFNCVNPQDSLKSEKEKNTSKSDLYWGIGWGVLALLMAIGLFSKDKEKENINNG